MPRRSDIKKILVLGSGPIKIGQACEFDYSGTQACKALKEEGYDVILVNSNPATIMTDPNMAWRTYVEPLTPYFVQSIIERERPDALLPTMGGQTALNVAVELARAGLLSRYGVELIGARLESIEVAEDRALFREKMIEIGMPVPRSFIVHSIEEVEALKDEVPMPAIVRAAFTLGGTGSGIASTYDELLAVCRAGIQASPAGEVLIEESIIGWKEIELEVVRDSKDNFIVVCGIENFDPMGVHTGDSITVAPIQTLSDREYQALRNAARLIIRAIGIDCGGSNIQFAVNPETGEFVVIEMNPRVSRSSALASKATGYPIAKVAARLAVGLTLDEIPNDVAGISACFEPSVDYVVSKIPRFNFDKFYGASDRLGTAMKSVGEAMAVGATFTESMQKALRSLELGVAGFCPIASRENGDRDCILERLKTPSRYRLADLWGAFSLGLSNEEIFEVSGIDRWFVEHLREIFSTYKMWVENLAEKVGKEELSKIFSQDDLRSLKKIGFSDRQVASLINDSAHASVASEDDVWRLRKDLAVSPVFKAIDTCAGEFPTNTRYLYSTYADQRREVTPLPGKKVIVLGSGPNRIGQAIEFDYCCVQASLTLRELNVQSIIVNCNPETVSTDFDVSDVLYFEPLTLEDVTNIAEAENPDGIIVQFGGQTPLILAQRLNERGFKILGTSCEATAIAEDRGKFRQILEKIGLRQPSGSIAHTREEALACAEIIGYPIMLRPSFVLGGKAMFIVRSKEKMEELLSQAFAASPGAPLLIDQYLNPAIEIDVDAVSDGTETIIAGIMEHIEEAGVHSGDSSCFLPPRNLDAATIAGIREATAAIARELNVVGLMNVQYAVKDGALYVIEVNPRASRTVPFVSKATGIKWANIATRAIMGERLSDMRHLYSAPSNSCAVKTVVIPYDRFPDSQVLLGPEMRSTGEVMGIAADFQSAVLKAQIAADKAIARTDSVFISAAPSQSEKAARVALAFARAGLSVFASGSTAERLPLSAPLRVAPVDARHGDDLILWLRKTGIARVISLSHLDSIDDEQSSIRRAAIAAGVALSMTASEAMAVAEALACPATAEGRVMSLQEHHLTGVSSKKGEIPSVDQKQMPEIDDLQSLEDALGARSNADLFLS